MVDLTKLSDEELESISSGNLKNLSEETLRLISGAQPPAGSVAPSVISSGPETAEKFQAEADAKRAAIVQSFEENSKKDASTNPMTMAGVLTSTPALVTGAALLGALTTYAAPKVYKSVKERFMSKTPDVPIRIDPIGFEAFANPLPSTQPNVNQAPTGQSALTPEELQARAAQLKTPAPGMPSGPDIPPQFAPGPVSPAGNIPPAPVPTYGISETVASKGDVKQAIQQTIAKEIDKPDLRPTYQRNKENPIGPQAYNWVAGQQGPKAPEVWQNIVGDKNVPYSEFMERYKPVYEGAYGGGYGDPDAFNQPAKNSSYRKPSMIPSQIKGSASPGAMGASALAAVIPALAVAGVEGYKGNKEAVNRELKDAWDSLKSVVTWPYDVSKAATKGDFGPLKDVLMSVNPATLLLNEANKNDKKAIQKMIEDERYAAQVGGGRGIAPPSAYKR